MAQENWNYYVAPKGTESRTNALIGMVQNAANTRKGQLAKEKQEKEAKRKETKRDAEITRNRNEKQLDQQQNSMQMYNQDIRNAGVGTKGQNNAYATGILSKTYTMEDKKEFADLSRQVATKSCGACTEQLSRISEMKSEPGVTRNFIELFSAEFEQMDKDIENNKFDKNNNSSLLALRGVLQGRKGYETGYDYGIRRLSDGSQELWVTGPEVEGNRGKEYVINSKELSQAAENGGGVYASGYDINKELQSVDDSMRVIGENGVAGAYKEEFLGKPKERISSDGKEIETIRSRDPKDAELIYNQQITANATADFDNPASAIATWNTELKNEDDESWSYEEWEDLFDYEKNGMRRLYEDRMREKFKSQIHTDFDKDVIISKRENPNYKEGSDAPTQTIFEDMSKDLSSAFTQAFPYENDNIEINGDKITTTIEGEKGDDGEIGELKEVTYDMTKKKDYVTFYEFLAKGRGNFDGTSDANKAARETFRNKVKAEWEKINRENLAFKEYQDQQKINVGALAE